MASTHPPFTDSSGEIWEQNESIIRQLYETERKTLKEVKQVMESEHGFPITPLSTYETKLRDRLGLRKKLKKADWVAVHHHYLSRDGKDTGIYLNGTRIPWKKAWKEIRRSGARSANKCQHARLPTGIVVRTPSPVTEPLVLRPSPEYREESPAQSPIVLVSLSTDPFTPQSSRTHVSEPQDIIRLLQGHQNLCVSIHDSNWESRTSSSFQLALEENVVALQNIPWVLFKNELLSITHGLEFDPTSDFVGGLLSNIDSSGLLGFTPTSPMFCFLKALDPAPTTSVSTWNTNAHYLLAEAIYLISNNLLDTRCESFHRGPPICPDIIQLLLLRTPKIVLLGLFQCNLPTIRAVWEVLVYHAGLHGYKDVFILLIEIGLRHSGWVLSNGYYHLAAAASMDALNVIQDLLKTGVSLDFYFKTPYSIRVMPIIEAAATGNMECVKLLLGVCDVNHCIYTNIHQTTGPPRMNRDCIVKPSIFQSFLGALFSRRIVAELRRDHAYLHNSFSQTKSGLLLIDLDLDNEQWSQTLDIFLNSGANVDLTWGVVEDVVNGIYEDYPIPVEWRPTILEGTYYLDLNIFKRLLPYSSQATNHITRPGVCLSAKRGTDALLEYLTSKPTDAQFDRIKFLELALVEQFTMQNSGADIDVVRALIKFGVDLKLPSLSLPASHLFYLLMEKARRSGFYEGLHDILNLLLQSGIGIDPEVLEAGVEENGIDILLILSRHTDISKSGAKALLKAARFDNYEAVSWLLEAGVDINAVVEINSEPWSIIALATIATCELFPDTKRARDTASYEMLKYLIDHGAMLKIHPDDLNAFDFLHRILSHSSINLFPDTLRLLLNTIVNQHDLSKPGVCLLEPCLRQDPDLADQEQRGLYDVPVENKLASYELLLRHGVPVRDSHVLAALILYEARHELIQETLNAGVDINAYFHFYICAWKSHTRSFSPIQAAASIGNRLLVDQLIRKGSDINQPALGIRGLTALQAACAWHPTLPQRKKDKLSLIQLLIENGADVNAPGEPGYPGRTALYMAAESGDLETALLLIHYKADLNPFSGIGNESILDHAARRGGIDMVQLLLIVGAMSSDPGRTGYDGAIKIAEKDNHFAVADLIRRHAENDIKIYGASLAMSFQNNTESALREIEDVIALQES
ncbi:uncharacterized protein GGS22DRAFT_153316 [Annulohypoxylon maeteangense]|uniref:uncharacterized protein n=1 Tax=Annulohypoxylon maeteangense TaxID=1927788 RepID=UPI00200881BF|nr:uncharacterized protein GGS22DRAFT_153316 [Annulohypoxylon maeteangense]KAI0889164.1 hypothetical protein GGS22DRAFT_153316 [Annulohypoxylon maeteangense]